MQNQQFGEGLMGKKSEGIYVKRKCARPECNNVIIIKQKSLLSKRKYCSVRCSSIETSKLKRSAGQARIRCVCETHKRKDRKVYTPWLLQLLPVDFKSNDGGPFARVCNAILSGEKILLSINPFSTQP